MSRALPIGIQDFKKIRDGGYLYVDKTDMIPQILTERSEVYLYTRPRRFGKSLNLSMLDAFFNLSYSSDNTWFDGLKVSDCRECDQHRNAYPVIHLDFKLLNVMDRDTFIDSLVGMMAKLYDSHGYLLESDMLTDREKRIVAQTIDEDLNLSKTTEAILTLSELLHKHHGRRTILLIDEYDNPIHNAYGKTHHQVVLDIMRGMLSSALKGNRSLAFGVVTGVMQIAKESIFSGLNNLKVNNIFSTGFDEMFGFTGDEVRTICDEYGHPDKYDEAREWYDGYRFGNADVYNPWSLLNYIDEGFKPGTYWAGTSGNSIIDTLLDNADGSTFDEIGLLARGVPVPKTVDPTVTFADLRGRPDNIYSVMVMSGYLRA
ncbi:MAG: AAA family ATPase, partial [Candidatus Methanomethylophilaceae archaeon]|nr:AAA family ATPase [Candidatus Methanomethylophilaceae archaeon]